MLLLLLPAQRQVMREVNHAQASRDMFGGLMGGAFHASSWTVERLGELWVRCPSCEALRDARVQQTCGCGTPGGARPAFW